MKHTKKILFFSILCFFAFNASAQRKLKQLDEQKSDEQQRSENNYGSDDSWKDKWLFGGNFSVMFGSNYSLVMLQPQAAYKLYEKTLLGAGFTYIYINRAYTYNNTVVKVESNIYGPNIFSRQYINENIFAHGEFQSLNYDYYNDLSNKVERIWGNSLYLGGGYGQNPGVYIMVLYDVLWNNRTSFSASPLDIRAGIFF